METIVQPLTEPGSALELPRVLVVGTDLTDADLTVGTVAIRLAVMLDAAVMLVHVLDTGAGDEAARGEPNEAMHRALAARVRERVEVARDALEVERARIAAIDRDGHAVVRVTLADGRPSEMMLQLAREQRRAWIVVGARATTTLLGQTSDHVLRHAGGPVLTVPDGCADALVGPVLVAVDGGATSARVLAAGGELARALGRSLDVLHVQSASDAGAPAHIADQLRALPADVASSRAVHLLVQQTSIADAITDHTRTTPASLLVVGAGGMGTALDRVLGSTALSITHAAHVPVLIVR